MSIEEVSPEEFAELFHHYHQALAPDFGGAGTRGAEAWEEISQQEKNLLIAAARLAVMELARSGGDDPKRYFAKPGEAEWGC